MSVSVSPALSELALLRAASARIAAAKTLELPHVVATQLQLIKSCSHLLSNSWTSQSGSAKGDAAQLVHRLVTQITTLLQGRHPEERWAAAVLIKAVVEAGGHEMLSRTKPWISGLLTNLRRSDPASVRAIYVLTLTRIFMLTWAFPSLIRENTTPSLPQFIKTCIANVSSATTTDREQSTVLESLTKLIPHHPTVFRAFSKDLDGVKDLILGSVYPSEATRLAAVRLGAALHYCAPKGASTAAWEEGVSTHITTCDQAADKVLAFVDENAGAIKDVANRKSIISKTLLDQTPAQRAISVTQAAAQLCNTLDHLTAFLTGESAAPVSIPVKRISALCSRLLVVVATKDGLFPKYQGGITRDDKDLCGAILPRIHIATLKVYHALLVRMPSAMTTLSSIVIQQLSWLFRAEGEHEDVRTAIYSVIGLIVSSLGLSIGKQRLEVLAPILRACCDDILPMTAVPEAVTLATSLGNGNKQSNGPSESAAGALPVSKHGVKLAAEELVGLALRNLPRSIFSDVLRSQLDRTAVLAGQSDLLLASVLNPSKRKEGRAVPSLLPFLARTGSNEPAVEALLRPRAPLLQSGALFSADGGSTVNEADQELTGVTTDAFAAESFIQTELAPLADEPVEVIPERIPLKRSLEESLQPLASDTNEAKRQKDTASDVDMVDSVRADAAMDASRAPSSGTVQQTAGPIQASSAEAEDSDDEDFEIPNIDMSDEE